MSRNKYPEETRKLIIENATNLFLEKGYENTTIQDIIDSLGGLTKGAVYHHFASKKDILIAVMNDLYSNNSLLEQWSSVLKQSDLSGKEKIKRMFVLSLNDPDEIRFASMKVDYKKTPELLSDYLNRSITHLAPTFFEPAIREGIDDGSIKTDYPKELAQAMMMLANMWLNPIVFPCDTGELKNKFMFLCDLAEKYGLEGLFEDVYPAFESYTK